MKLGSTIEIGLKGLKIKLIFLLAIFTPIVLSLFSMDKFLKILQIDLPLLQLCIFPIVIYLVLKLRILGERIPKFVLVFACLGVFNSINSAFSLKSINPREFLVSRLDGDLHEAESRIFREGINEAINSKKHSLLSAKALRLSDSDVLVNEIFTARENLNTIIQGDTKNLILSFPRLKPVRLKNLNFNLPDSFKVKKLLGELKFIPNIHQIELSFEPELKTQEFLASFLPANLAYQRFVRTLSDTSKDSKLNKLSPIEKENIELELRNSGSIFGGWKSYQHRALSWFLHANYQLIKLLKSREYRPGLMECAINSYQEAAGFLSPTTHKVAYAAIHNNYAVAHSIKRIYEDNSYSYKESKDAFKIASKFKKFKDTLQLNSILVAASQNDSTLHEIRKELKKLGLVAKKPDDTNPGASPELSFAVSSEFTLNSRRAIALATAD